MRKTILLLAVFVFIQSSNAYTASKYFYEDVKNLKSKDTQTRKTASNYLRSDDIEYHPVLIRALKDNNSVVRANIAYALGNAKGKWAWDALLTAINDPSSRVRKEVIGSLSYMLTGKALTEGTKDYDPKTDPKTINIYKKFLKDSDATIRKEAVYYVSYLKGSEVVEILMKGLNDPNSIVRENALIAFKYINNEDKGALREAINIGFKDPDVYVRRAAIGLLNVNTDNDSVELLIKYADDKDLGTRIAAVNAMSGTINPKVKSALLSKLNDKYYRVRIAALNSISGIENISYLKKALNDKDGLVRLKAIEKLGSINEDKSISTLIGVFNNIGMSDNLRYYAIYYLYLLKSEKALGAFIKGIQEEDYNIRYYSFSALKSIKSKKAIPDLILLLKNSKYQYKTDVMSVLGELKSKESIPCLKNIILSKDEAKWLKITAIKTIGSIQDKTTLDFLKELAKDNDEEIKNAAKDAIKNLLLIDIEDES